MTTDNEKGIQLSCANSTEFHAGVFIVRQYGLSKSPLRKLVHFIDAGNISDSNLDEFFA